MDVVLGADPGKGFSVLTEKVHLSEKKNNHTLEHGSSIMDPPQGARLQILCGKSSI